MCDMGEGTWKEWTGHLFKYPPRSGTTHQTPTCCSDGRLCPNAHFGNTHAHLCARKQPHSHPASSLVLAPAARARRRLPTRSSASSSAALRQESKHINHAPCVERCLACTCRLALSLTSCRPTFHAPTRWIRAQHSPHDAFMRRPEVACEVVRLSCPLLSS